ncbi:hypothetical protein GDO81_005194 [Engystomops pustulosus]|uniref:Secreted protein n=1 Tax=Engystomops pustulosus TaxID=76066 RepID=A0AAV7CLF8_ENGPU|nr:hypothetical protein GDO81_005194 [Engystomops pustulosus]
MCLFSPSFSILHCCFSFAFDEKVKGNCFPELATFNAFLMKGGEDNGFQMIRIIKCICKLVFWL